jgi:CubicO group peptidase (beta-lactamase class C family)
VLDFSEFDSAVGRFVHARGLKGASAVLVHARCGIVHIAGYGEYAADRSYLVGSSSKIVSAGILMRLADEGLVDLDAPIGQYLSGWTPGGKPELTLAQLLSNSAGLVGLVDNPLYRPYACQYRDRGTLSECAKSIYTADDGDDREAPDTAFRYGGGQWQLAGGIAEAVSGKSWSELVVETYAEPCDAAEMGYTNQFSKAGQAGGIGAALEYPEFFQADPANLPATDNPNVEGGLFITAEHYGKLLLMHLRGGSCANGRVLSEEAVARMQVDRILEEYNGSTAGMAGTANGGMGLEGYGLGWWIDRVHVGVFADPGVYGAFPWLDLRRQYGGFLVLEADGSTGAALWASVKALADHQFDQLDSSER